MARLARLDPQTQPTTAENGNAEAQEAPMTVKAEPPAAEAAEGGSSADDATGTITTTTASTTAEATSDAALDAAGKSPKFQRCWEAVEKHGWDTDAWIALMTEVQQLPIADARAYYDKFLAQFPTSVRFLLPLSRGRTHR